MSLFVSKTISNLNNLYGPTGFTGAQGVTGPPGPAGLSTGIVWDTNRLGINPFGFVSKTYYLLATIACQGSPGTFSIKGTLGNADYSDAGYPNLTTIDCTFQTRNYTTLTVSGTCSNFSSGAIQGCDIVVYTNNVSQTTYPQFFIYLCCATNTYYGCQFSIEIVGGQTSSTYQSLNTYVYPPSANSISDPTIFSSNPGVPCTIFLASVLTTLSNQIQINNSTPSTSISTGTLVIPSGGIGVSGNVNIGGNVNIAGNVSAVSFNATSDYRLKSNIKEIPRYYTTSILRPVEYEINKTHQLGLIAHELQEFYPQLVSGEKDGIEHQSVNYIGLIPILIRDIQNLKKELEELKKK